MARGGDGDAQLTRLGVAFATAAGPEVEITKADGADATRMTGRWVTDLEIYKLLSGLGWGAVGVAFGVTSLSRQTDRQTDVGWMDRGPISTDRSGRDRPQPHGRRRVG